MYRTLVCVFAGLSLFVFACDLAVTTEMDLTDIEYEDAILQDIRISKDVTSDTPSTDIWGADNEQPDVVVIECETNRDCYGERPFCKDGICVECLSSGDCKEGEICNERNECHLVERSCSRPSDCDMGFICKDSKCVVGCITDKDCPPATKPNNKFCNLNSQNPLCVECLTDSDCVKAGIGTKCDEFKVCITISCNPPCQDWEHCTNDGKCELNDGACNNDKDCQIVDPSTICDLSSHTCIFRPQCTIDADCDALCPDCGGICKAKRCECRINCPKQQLCEVCTDDKECEVGLVCKGLLGTKYCQPPNCQNNNDCGGKYCVFGYCACGM